MRSCPRGQTSILERQPIYVGGEKTFARLGVECVLLYPPTLPEAETLGKLDELAGVAGKV